MVAKEKLGNQVVELSWVWRGHCQRDWWLPVWPVVLQTIEFELGELKQQEKECNDREAPSKDTLLLDTYLQLRPSMESIRLGDA